MGGNVTLTGTNLSSTTAVRFNGTAAAFAVVNATILPATVLAGAISGSVTVTTPGGITNRLAFTVAGAPGGAAAGRVQAELHTSWPAAPIARPGYPVTKQNGPVGVAGGFTSIYMCVILQLEAVLCTHFCQ